MKKLCTILLILIVSSLGNLYAQENFEEGYFISLEKDTIYGLINNKDWRFSPTSIEFRKTLESEIETLSYNQITGFVVNNLRYRSAKFQVELSPEDVNQLSKTEDFNIELREGFLQYYLQGEVSMLIYKSSLRKSLIYLERDGQVELLRYKKYMGEFRGQLRQKERKDYLTQLRNKFKDCADINKLLNDVKYDYSSISKFMNKVLQCNSKEIIYTFTKRKLRKDHEFHLGATGTDLSINAIMNFSYLNDLNWRISFNPTFGYGLNIKFPSNFYSSSLKIDFLFTGYSMTDQYSRVFGDQDFENHEVNLAVYALKLAPSYQYRFSKTENGVFMNIGVSSSLALGRADRFTQKTFFSIYEEETKPLFGPVGFSPGEYAFHTGLGYRIGHLQAQARYALGDGYSSHAYVRIRSHRVFFLLSYVF